MSLCCKTDTFLILNHHIILTFLLTKQPLSTDALLNLIAVDSWGKEWGQGRLSCSRWAEGDRWAARCVTNKTKITNATMRQSTVRWRRSMARGSRGRSTRAWWLFRVGCWVTAVVVGANRHGWCVSSVVVSRVFWSSARGERWIVDMRRLSLKWEGGVIDRSRIFQDFLRKMEHSRGLRGTSVKGEINSSAPKNAVLEIDIGSRWKEEYRRYLNIGTYLPH